MQYKDTSQQAFLFRPIYFICILLFLYFSLGTVDSHLKSRSPHKKVWAPLLQRDRAVSAEVSGASAEMCS